MRLFNCFFPGCGKIILQYWFISNRRCFVLFGYLTFCNIFKIEKSLPVLCSAPKVQDSTSPAPLALSGMKFSCDKCSYFTNRESKMEEHTAAHDGRWICSVCNKAFVKVNKMVSFNPKQELCVTVWVTLHETVLFLVWKENAVLTVVR